MPSSSMDVVHFEELLDGIVACIRQHLPCSVLVAGDFNAWSEDWGYRRSN